MAQKKKSPRRGSLLHGRQLKVRGLICLCSYRRKPGNILDALGAGAGCNGRVFKPDIKLGLVVDELFQVNARNDIFVCTSELTAGMT